MNKQAKSLTGSKAADASALATTLRHAVKDGALDETTVITVRRDKLYIGLT